MNVAKKSKGTRNEYLCSVIWILNLLIQGPGEAVLGVLDLETEFGELVADGVAQSPVLFRLGLLALLQKHVDDGHCASRGSQPRRPVRRSTLV